MGAFPVTAKDEDEVQPTPVQEEPTRAEIAAHPENLEQRIQRTRRYFRLTSHRHNLRYAKGLDSAPGDFA